MTDAFVEVAPDSTGKMIDTTELTVGANTVERQRVVVSGAAAAELADVKNAEPASTLYGQVVRPIPSTAATPAVSRVNSSATNVTLQAANSARRGLLIFNESTATLYLKFGATATITSYTVQVPAGGLYELPANPIYTGIVDGLWASVNGAAQVTELT